MKSVAIIGAGLSGISLARKLQGCAAVTVFEKSRGCGGRMATRRAGDFQFDHGAQFFTARSQAFQELMVECANNNQVRDWQPKVLTLDPQIGPFKREWFEPHYVSCPGMNNLCKSLAQGLNVIPETRVSAIDAIGGRWALRNSEAQSLGEFDWIVSTLPAVQADEIIPECFAQKSQLREVDLSPCFSLMLGFETLPKLNFDAAVVRNSPIGWIAVNSSKPDRSTTPSIVVHSDNIWARTQLDKPLEDVQQQMLEALHTLLGEAWQKPKHLAIHRWKYARAEIFLEKNYLLDEPSRLAACGDWCRGNRVEDAYLSGLELGKHMQEILA